MYIYIKSHSKLYVQNHIFIDFKLFSLSEFELNFSDTYKWQDSNSTHKRETIQNHFIDLSKYT